MFEGIKSFFLQGKVKYEHLLNESKQTAIDSKIIERMDKLIESQSLENQKDNDESKWVDLSRQSAKELSEADILTMREQAYKLYYKNPYARNIVRNMEKYVAGRGLAIMPDSDLDEVKALWEKFWKVANMNRRVKEIVRRFFRDGEVFLRSFKLGEGLLSYRFLNPLFIANPTDAQVNENTTQGIETDPDDIEKVICYWYKGKKVPAKEIIHEKAFVDSDVKRGRSIFEVIAEELSMFKDWQRDRMKLNKIRALIGLVRKVNAGPTEAANIAKAYETSRRLAPDGTSYHQTPEGVSIITANKGVDYEFKTPNLQAGDVAEDGRGVLRSACAGVGQPEYVVTSDASNSNYASTMVAEAPFVREVMDWQDFFKTTFETIFEQVIEYAMDQGVIPRKTEEESEEPTIDPITGVPMIDPLTGKPAVTITMKTVPVPCTCKVVFPEIIHRDIKQETDALTIQLNNRTLSKHTYASRLDADYDSEKEIIKQEEEEDAEEGATDPYAEDRANKIDAVGNDETQVDPNKKKPAEMNDAQPANQ